MTVLNPTTDRPMRALPTRELPPGAFDREVLASALTFIVTSIRRGAVVTNPHWGDVELLSGFDDEGLAWDQGQWTDTFVPAPAVERLIELSDRYPDLADEEELPEEAKRRGLTRDECGTGCCIAGWIKLHMPEPDESTPDEDPRWTGIDSEVATFRLVGFNTYGPWRRHWLHADDAEARALLPGLPAGLDPVVVLDAIQGDGTGVEQGSFLYAGSNELMHVFEAADRLARLYGQEPFLVDADGTVR